MSTRPLTPLGLTQRQSSSTNRTSLINRLCVRLVELYFSILQRKVLTPNDLYSLDELIQRIHAFGQRYSALDKPFAWTFTRHDLERRLRNPLLQLDSPALLRIAA